MSDPEKRALLERAIERSGLSTRAFAEQVMVRDERTVRRWRAGTIEIPDVVVRRLRELAGEPPP